MQPLMLGQPLCPCVYKLNSITGGLRDECTYNPRTDSYNEPQVALDAGAANVLGGVGDRPTGGDLWVLEALVVD